jgi:type IV secretory pathway VirB2 component (pilin)
MYGDPSALNSIASAVGWAVGTLAGTVAIAIAIIAVASIGTLMLTGRLEARRAVRIILGCFIVFGASTIAAGIQAAIFAQPADTADESVAIIAPPAPPPVSTAPATAPNAFDPYAGAALPPRQ